MDIYLFPGLFGISSLRKMSFDLGLDPCFLPLATQWNYLENFKNY